MKSYIKDNHTVIEADDGKFLMLRNGSDLAKSFSLGCYDRAENYDELPMEEWPQNDENVDNEIE